MAPIFFFALRAKKLQELVNGVRGGNPRTVPYSKMSSKVRTELQINLSRAKMSMKLLVTSVFASFLKKTGEHAEKPKFSSKRFENFRKCPNASERIQMRLHASKCIRMHPNRSNRSEQVRKLQTTCENLEKHAKCSPTFSRTLVSTGNETSKNC